MDHYRFLGVSRTASQDEIKTAYHRLAKKWHPDKNPEHREEATRRFKDLQKAFDTLKDPISRRAYDATLGGAGGDGDSSRKRSYDSSSGHERDDAADKKGKFAYGQNANNGSPFGNNFAFGSGGSPSGNNFPFGSGGNPFGNNFPFGSGGNPFGNNFAFGSGGSPSGNNFAFGSGGNPFGNNFPFGPGGSPFGTSFPFGSGDNSFTNNFNYMPSTSQQNMGNGSYSQTVTTSPSGTRTEVTTRWVNGKKVTTTKVTTMSGWTQTTVHEE